jgi:hypothetical protein
MIQVNRVQTAGKDHECDECGGTIEEGQKYNRLAQFDSWDDIKGVDKALKAAFSDLSDPYVQKQFWKHIVSSKEVLILKTHRDSAQCHRETDEELFRRVTDYGVDYDRHRGEDAAR